MKKSFFIVLTLCLALPHPASAFEMVTPVDCELGTNCFIQNFVDTKPGTEHQDYRCGALSYHGHKGTDFRLPNYKAMREGVAVLAAADGTVKALRDGMENMDIKKANLSNIQSIKNRECGNGIVVDHGDGWETQYCHMQKGSLSVSKGDIVKAGQTLGLIGLSGKTEFPHLHISVRHNGKEVDPFTGNVMESGQCHTSPHPDEISLWASAVRPSLIYSPTALLGLGFSEGATNIQKARNGEYDDFILHKSTEALVVWTDTMGIQAGDTLEIELHTADGKEHFFDKEFDKPKALMFYFAGIKRKTSEWPSGTYSAIARIKRTVDDKDQVLFEQKRQFVLE